ncbi:hypothetical protein PVK06_011955 [Gossypium arboreum]|uniref:Uncharacterized protein n=1 Tax=Gossypium arboreum TaxID=29729 RepID=A0ABR0QBE7_GOSAR|nr:hypothetical protein PVK06_011955 [Gossypium arboreum]
MTFCSRYLEDVETRLNRPSRNVGLTDHNLAETYLFQSYGEPIGKVEFAELDDRSWVQAHPYVLFRHDSIEPLHKIFGHYSMKCQYVAYQMPDSDKNQALDNIKERFSLEVSNAYIKKALGKNGETIKAL